MLHLKKQKKNIEETAKEYNLSGKLKDSQRLCCELTSDNELFSDMPIVFLLVTDIDVNKNGIDHFNYNLNALASTSTVTYSECITKSHQTLNSEIYIQHDYICCKDFDEHMKNLWLANIAKGIVKKNTSFSPPIWLQPLRMFAANDIK